MTRRNIIAILGIASINPMKSFKKFLSEMASERKINCDINGICDLIRADESAGNEEKILSVYKDSKGLDTIGHGHLVTPESESIFNQVFEPEQKANLKFVSNVLSGKGKLTPAQADRLLVRDVSKRLPDVVKLVPNFEKMSTDLQANLASEHFRGMLGKSPNALKALNAGDYEGFASNYINAKDYRESNKSGTGIYKRMDRLAKSARTELARQRKTQGSSLSTTQAPQ